MYTIVHFVVRRLFPCLLIVSSACDIELAEDAAEVFDGETGRIGYAASSLAGARALLARADASGITMEPEALASLRRHVHGTTEGRSTRNLPECPSSKATTTTYRINLGLSWGAKYVAEAEWKRSLFGPPRPVRTEASVCAVNGCTFDSGSGHLVVEHVVPPNNAPVYASARVIVRNNGAECIASSAFQYWPAG